MPERDCNKEKKELEKELEDFLKKLIENQKDMPEEFKSIVDKNFWELLS